MQIILNLKTPTRYVFSLKKRIHKDGDLRGMKSHDFHVMMQDILPLCMKHLMAKGCRMVIISFSHMFKKLCAKIVDPKKNVWFQNWCGGHTVAIGKRIPSFFFIPWRTINMWSNTYTLDISYGTLHEDIKGLCENKVRPEGSMA